MRISPYIRIARPDNWFKNVFVVPGAIVAAELAGVSPALWWKDMLVGLAATCLVASSNYVINEWLDREFDQYHPIKKNRPSVTRGLSRNLVYTEYVLLGAAGQWLGTCVSRPFAGALLALFAMGVIYNVRPLRSKERPYIDVLSESINNPIRLLLGWFTVTSTPLPPSSLVVAYWMGGAYLMAVKRYSEYRFIGDPERAALYRRSFKFYTEERLLVSSVFYALLAASLGGVFLVKYRIELVLTLPLVALMFAWYFQIGLKPDSAAQHPERMHKERAYSAYVVCVGIAMLLCFVIRAPALTWLLDNAFIASRP